MPTPTYDLIASNVLGSSAASVTFSSIPATYGDLVLVVEALGSGGTVDINVTFNSDTGSNYPFVSMNGTGTGTSSLALTGSNISGINATTTSKSINIFQIMDYSVTDKHKTVLTRRDRADSATQTRANRWADTSAINTIAITTPSNNYAAGSTFYLYGIAG